MLRKPIEELIKEAETVNRLAKEYAVWADWPKQWMTAEVQKLARSEMDRLNAEIVAAKA